MGAARAKQHQDPWVIYDLFDKLQMKITYWNVPGIPMKLVTTIFLSELLKRIFLIQVVISPQF